MIRPLSDSLLDEAVSLWHEVGLTRPWNDPYRDLQRAIAGPASAVLAAEQGRRLLGTVMVGHDGHRGWIYYLAVAPSEQRCGIGRQLVVAAESWLAPHVPKLQLMIRADNLEAIAFYERLGYAHSDVHVLARRLDG